MIRDPDEHQTRSVEAGDDSGLPESFKEYAVSLAKGLDQTSGKGCGKNFILTPYDIEWLAGRLRTRLRDELMKDAEPVGNFVYTEADPDAGIATGIWEEVISPFGVPLYNRPQLLPEQQEELERLRKEAGQEDHRTQGYYQSQAHPLNCNHINQGSMDAAADAYELEYAKAKCRESYDNYYHKIRADIGYDDWQKAWLKGFAKGSQELTQLRAKSAALKEKLK